MEYLVEVNSELCIGCKACIDVCPRDCFILNTEGKSEMGSHLCHSCGHCISVCPEKAIKHRDFDDEEYPLISDILNSKMVDGEQLFYLLKSVRSTRKYKSKPISKEILAQLVETGRFSPTGHHAQNVEMVIVNTSETIQQLKDETAVAFRGFLKKIDNPFFRFLGILIGKGDSIRKAQGSRARLERMLAGFEVGTDYLFHDAPVIVVFHAKTNGVVPLENCTIASTYMRIVCEGFGLGSCYIGYLVYSSKYNHKIREILNIPKENTIFQVMIVGYPKHKFRTFVARNPAKVQWK